MQKIPFFSLERQWSSIETILREAMNATLASQQYVNGPATIEFEQKLAAYTGATFAVGCNSGTDALWLALKALGLKEHEIVLTTPFSFIASSSEIVALGAIPVFIDIDPETFNISASNLERWLSTNAVAGKNGPIHRETGKKIAGILTVNIFGQCANYPAIKKIADTWKLWIIEDAAQSIGSSIENRAAGTLGDISCFSFYPTKNLGALGDAGAVTTSNENLYQELKKLRNHGRLSHYEYEGIGKNSRLDSLQAAALLAKLPLVDAYNKRRRAIAEYYDQALLGLPSIKTPLALEGYHTYHQYCIRVAAPQRDALRAFLTERGIGTNVFYPTDFTRIRFLNPVAELIESCPIAQALTQQIIALPIWPELTEQEIEYVATSIRAFFEQHLTITQDIMPGAITL